MRPTTGWTLLGGAAVLVMSQLATAAAPLYDGIGFPDEPYRYVVRPAGATTTKPPSSVTATTPTANGLNTQALLGNTEEQAPQLGLYLPRHSLVTAPSATSLTLQVTPVAAVLQPSNGIVTGNAYTVTITSDAGPVSFPAQAANGVLMMRSSSADVAVRVFEYQAAGQGTLRQLTTEQVGNDRYQTRFAGPGTYSLAQLASAKAPSGFPYALVLSIAGLVVLMGGVIVALRRVKQPG